MARGDLDDFKRRLDVSERKRAFLQRVVNRRGADDDSTLWTLADLMTLLLIFFILFYSNNMNKVIQGLGEGGGVSQTPIAKPSPVQDTPMTSKVVDYEDDELDPAIVKAREEERDESLEALRQKVMETVPEENKNDFSMRWDDKKLIMVLGERVTFDVGEAELLSDFQPVLQRISGFIASQKGYRVVVSGHTDNVPINTYLFPSNWELSAARAVNVAKFLIAHGMNPFRVSIEGYSMYRPIQENDTPYNRRINRRVEIALVKDQGNG